MSEQPKRITSALETALQMEIEGKEFYQKAGQKSVSTLAQELFKQLAAQEDIHYQKIKEVYEAVKTRGKWPEKESTFKQQKSIQSVFKDAVDRMDVDFKAPSSEIEALKVGMSMEDKSYSFYTNREEESESPAEKAFYKALTGEERAHYLTLSASVEYLSDPAGWFTMKERWSLNGM